MNAIHTLFSFKTMVVTNIIVQMINDVKRLLQIYNQLVFRRKYE